VLISSNCFPFQGSQERRHPDVLNFLSRFFTICKDGVGNIGLQN